MRQIAVKVAALTAVAVLMLAAQAQAVVTIEVGSAEGAAGSTVPVDVTLNTGGDDVAGTENVITFPAGARIALNEDDDPDCVVNDDIDKSATGFSFQPANCEGTACTGVKVVVLSIQNVDPIPDGSVMYTCQFAIDAGATGALSIACSDGGASDPEGQSLETTCTNGTINVGGTGPTPTPTTGVEAPVNISVGDAQGAAGSTVPVDVTLEINTVGTEVAGTENVLTFSSAPGSPIRIARNEDDDPDCVVNDEIDKDATGFSFQPAGCTDNCTGVKVVVLSIQNVDPIPGGSVMYTCQVEIDESATGTHELGCTDAGASTPDGMSLDTSCSPGTITVGGGGDTPTPTATTGGATATVGAATATATVGGPTPTRTSIIPPTVPITICDDGCAIATPATSANGWLLFLPVAALLWLRRRSR